MQIVDLASISASRATRHAGLFSLLVIAFLAIQTNYSAAGTSRSANPVRPSERTSPFSEAQELIKKNQLDQAREKIEAQLKVTPSSVEGYNLLGIVLAAQKQYGPAEDAFQRALSFAPSSVKTHNNLGNLYLTEQKMDLAEKEFKKALNVAPANHDANYNLGLLLLAKGEPVPAITYFERVHPQNVETGLNLVRAYLQAGKNTQALRSSRELSAGHKQDVELHFTLGVLLASAKEYKPAQLELEQANALKPETFEILHNLGQDDLLLHEYGKADLTLARALKLKPDSVETLYLLAKVYVEQARPLDALDLLVRARRLAPENTDVIFLMARVSMTQNYFEDAIPLLEAGLKIAPNRPDLHAALGESYFMSGKTESAIEQFKILIELDPSAASYAFLGLAYRHLGRFDEALKYFQEGLKKDRHNSSCLFNVGYIEERQGNYTQAEELFQQALGSNPDFPEVLLELANLRMKDKKYAEASEVLRKYVKIARDPADGYYKLAMAERGLHQTRSAERDLAIFQTLSKNSTNGSYPYQHLFDYLDQRSMMSVRERAQLDVQELSDEIQKHPGQPQNLYLLAEAYLKLGRVDVARETIAELDQASTNDYRTQTGIGVLFARYHLYDDAIQHFQTALGANADSDDVKFDLANAYLRRGRYAEALGTAKGVSPAGQQDDSYLSLLGDVEAHVGDTATAAEIFRQAIRRNPDNDQYYLSLTLVELRDGDLTGAEQTLETGLKRIPGSGKILWGLGLVSVLRGDSTAAAEQLERAVDLLPEWAGSYSTLGLFYYQTGQVDKAREVLDRFKGSNLGGLDVARIEQALSKPPEDSSGASQSIPVSTRQQLFQFALLIADRSL